MLLPRKYWDCSLFLKPTSMHKAMVSPTSTAIDESRKVKRFPVNMVEGTNLYRHSLIALNAYSIPSQFTLKQEAHIKEKGEIQLFKGKYSLF